MTDHKNEAEKWIAGTDKSGATHPASVGAAMARAQVHATLALVEALNTANLITWTARDGYQPSSAVAQIITERLGL